MAAKKLAAKQEPVAKKSKPAIAVKIPKFVTSSTDKVWRRAMISAIKEQAQRARYGNKELSKLVVADAAEDSA